MSWLTPAADAPPEDPRLTAEENHRLAASPRAGEIAALVVRGLGRRFAAKP